MHLKLAARTANQQEVRIRPQTAKGNDKNMQVLKMMSRCMYLQEFLFPVVFSFHDSELALPA